MLDTRLYSFGGFTAVAPVHWTGPEQTVARGASTTRVKWGDLHGWAFHALAKGQPSLAHLIATTLPDNLAGATLVAVEDEGATLWYSAVFQEGKPVEGTETVFDDGTALADHLHNLARSSEIQNCALNQSLANRLPDIWETPLIIEPGLVNPEGVPTFVSPLSLSPRAIKRIKIGAGCLLGLAITGLGAWAAFSPKADLPPLIQTVYKAKSVETFVSECSDNLSSDWLRPLNWELVSAGCFDTRLSKKTDIKTATNQAGAYRVYKLSSGFNEQNARIMARHMLEAWPGGEHVLEDKTLTLIKPFENPVDYVDHPPQQRSIIAQVEEVFVGTVEAIGHNAVTNEINIRTKTTAQNALRRVLNIPYVEVRSIKTTGETTEMIIGPLTVSTLQEVHRP